MKESYFNGFKIQLLGLFVTLHGGQFEKFLYLEGPKKGKVGYQAIKPQK